MNQDIKILRELANRYAQIVSEMEPENVWELHASLNDLHPKRPIVLIDELPWHELNKDGFLTLQCHDPDFRQAEDFLRKTIFKHHYFPGDMLVRPYFPVGKIIHTTGFGVEIREETRQIFRLPRMILTSSAGKSGRSSLPAGAIRRPVRFS